MTKPLLLKPIHALCLAIISTPLFAPVSVASEEEMELVQAHSIVRSYRELRESCADDDYEKRRECIRALSSANEEYRAAKNVITKHESSNNTKIAS